MTFERGKCLSGLWSIRAMRQDAMLLECMLAPAITQ
jgi:hypothetical protein